MTRNKKKSSLFPSLLAGALAVFTVLSGLFLTSPKASAESSGGVDLTLTVPAICSLTITPADDHTITLQPTQSGTIGSSNIKSVCNDPGGLAVYAVGYTEDTHGNTDLTYTLNNNTYTIPTGAETSPTNSQWHMTLAPVTGAYTPTIVTGFDSAHIIPNTSTKVAYRESMTDSGTGATGANFTATFGVYIGAGQAPGTYTGKVKFTLVHPNTHPIPDETMLDTGQVISAKMKTLAAGTTKAYNAKTTDIKAIRMADSLPSGFVASDANTISTSTSRHPVYIFYDNADNAGIMYVYSGGYEIVMNPDSSHAFRSNLALADISGLKDWNTSKVTNMYLLLLDSTIGLNDLDPLIDWDTSSVENMRAMFKTNPTTLTAGYISSLTDISGLINWNVSNVTSMQEMFPVTPLSSLHGLENWDVSKVENMHMMFGCTDDYIDTSHLTDISALANWNTSSVTDMGAMFQNRKALTDLSALANWDTSKVTDTSYMFHGAGITSVETLTTGKNNNPKIWNTGNVTTMKQMFAWTPLTSLHGLENWDTSKLENVCGLVFSASRLTDVSALTNWDTARVSDMSATFKNTTSLQTIDLSGWSAASVTSMQEMFMNTTSLNTVYVSQAGLDSFNTAINNGATITDMWRDSGVSSFTVKP